jgi:hypothetical protein
MHLLSETVKASSARTFVFGVCTFDLQFSYVYPGWEGSAHDVRVLDDAMRSGGFKIPAGKFYLADAVYTNRWPFLSPYRGLYISSKLDLGAEAVKLTYLGTRYHLREQVLATCALQPRKNSLTFATQASGTLSSESLASLNADSNALTRLWSERYSFDTQQHLVFACTGLHNFIQSHESDDYFEGLEAEAEAQRTYSPKDEDNDTVEVLISDDTEGITLGARLQTRCGNSIKNFHGEGVNEVNFI